ncbi:MAG: energy transducer TonB [Prevotellaceae bacterium]|nr:energy transducer TonB [Prevotellaceae bacterium]
MRSQFFAPPYNSNEEGRIVVDIRVDDSGNVTSATIAKGTNITDNQLRNVTLEAARKIKFTSATGGTAMGTITYNFSLR